MYLEYYTELEIKNVLFGLYIQFKTEQETIIVIFFTTKLLIHIEQISFSWQEWDNKHFHFLQFSCEVFWNSIKVCDRTQSLRSWQTAFSLEIGFENRKQCLSHMSRLIQCKINVHSKTAWVMFRCRVLSVQ